MPPSTKYTQETIVDAAIRLIQNRGIEAFSVRNVAKTMKASTQPIYSCFENSNDLLEAVLISIKKRIIAYTKKSYTDKTFRNIGLGFMYFARDYPKLYSAFFLQNKQYHLFIDQFLASLRTAMDEDIRFLKMSAVGKDLLLEKMWIFTYGYASLIIQGLVTDTSNETIEKMVVEVGLAVIKDTMERDR